MAQISNANLQTLMDRMARWAAEANGDVLASAVAAAGNYTETSPNAGLVVANTDVIAALQTSALTYADANQIADLLGPIRDLNNANPAAQTYLASVMGNLRQALNVHGLRYNSPNATDLSGLDALLRALNASAPTLRAHGLFAKYFGGLAPSNVFTPRAFKLATLAITGATTGTFTHVAAIDATLYSSGQIMLRNTKTEGLTSTTITLTCTKSGSAISVAFTVANTTNDRLTAGDDTSKLITDCTALVSISGGVNTDTFDIILAPDRAINAV